MRRLVLVLALASLAACKPAPAEPPEKDLAKVTPATPAPGPFDGDLNALGTEPFWAVEIRGTTLKLTRPDTPDLIVPNPGPRIEGAKAVWPGAGLVVTLMEGQCSDGMSDRTYPWFAEVTLVDTVLKGCATRAGTVQPPA